MAKDTRASQAKNTKRLYVEIEPGLRDWLDSQSESEERSLRTIVERALRNERARLEAESGETGEPAKKKGKKAD